MKQTGYWSVEIMPLSVMCNRNAEMSSIIRHSPIRSLDLIVLLRFPVGAK